MQKITQNNVFFHNDQEEQPIKASGIIFQRTQNEKVEFLVHITTGEKLWDIGGKVDKSDKTILETATREFIEETEMFFTKQISFEKTKKYVSENTLKQFYINKSKYLLFIVKAPKFLRNTDFPFEYKNVDGVEKMLYWITANEFSNKIRDGQISPRLWQKIFFDYIKFKNGELPDRLPKKSIGFKFSIKPHESGDK
jgi:hypothetical protein